MFYSIMCAATHLWNHVHGKSPIRKMKSCWVPPWTIVRGVSHQVLAHQFGARITLNSRRKSSDQSCSHSRHRGFLVTHMILLYRNKNKFQEYMLWGACILYFMASRSTARKVILCLTNYDDVTKSDHTKIAGHWIVWPQSKPVIFSKNTKSWWLITSMSMSNKHFHDQ